MKKCYKNIATVFPGGGDCYVDGPGGMKPEAQLSQRGRAMLRVYLYPVGLQHLDL